MAQERDEEFTCFPWSRGACEVENPPHELTPISCKDLSQRRLLNPAKSMHLAHLCLQTILFLYRHPIAVQALYQERNCWQYTMPPGVPSPSGAGLPQENHLPGLPRQHLATKRKSEAAVRDCGTSHANERPCHASTENSSFPSRLSRHRIPNAICFDWIANKGHVLLLSPLTPIWGWGASYVAGAHEMKHYQVLVPFQAPPRGGSRQSSYRFFQSSRASIAKLAFRVSGTPRNRSGTNNKDHTALQFPSPKPKGCCPSSVPSVGVAMQLGAIGLCVLFWNSLFLFY